MCFDTPLSLVLTLTHSPSFSLSLTIFSRRWSSINIQQWRIYQGDFVLSSQPNNYQIWWKIEHILKFNVISLSLGLLHIHMHSHTHTLASTYTNAFKCFYTQRHVHTTLPQCSKIYPCFITSFGREMLTDGNALWIILFSISDHEVLDISIWMTFICMCDNPVCSFLSVTQSHHPQPHVNLHDYLCQHHLFPEGTRGTFTAMFKCHPLNL